MTKMMKCGHAAQGSRLEKDGSQIDACVICGCVDVAEEPDLTGRTARCTYAGRRKPQRRYANDECNYGCRGNPVCQCDKEQSYIGLAFFSHHPDKEQDEFYCGCFGWD